jgi:hypothetical protein
MGGAAGKKKKKWAKLLVTEKAEPALYTPSWGGRGSQVDRGEFKRQIVSVHRSDLIRGSSLRMVAEESSNRGRRSSDLEGDGTRRSWKVWQAWLGMYMSRWQQGELSFYGLPGAMTPQDGEKILEMEMEMEKRKKEKKKI